MKERNKIINLLNFDKILRVNCNQLYAETKKKSSHWINLNMQLNWVSVCLLDQITKYKTYTLKHNEAEIWCILYTIKHQNITWLNTIGH